MSIKKIAIVSLSSGILGEEYIQHEVKLGLERLRNYNIDVKFMDNSLKGIDFLKKHPEARAEDLIEAFSDDTIDMILCAIGGDDTYRLLPYLFENDKLRKVAKQKVFLGFSDTTMNHFMLNKIGIPSYYGQAFIPDICELSKEMLPYTKLYFEELLNKQRIQNVQPSSEWYEERLDYSKKSLGVALKKHINHGFELLRGASEFEGKILGGCLESIFDIFDNSRYEDTISLCDKYELFPSLEEWKGKILLLETSEEKPTPDIFREMIKKLEEIGLFDVISGVLVGKPQNETYYDEYKTIILDEISNKTLSIVYNVNVGHATPRCIIPFGINAHVNIKEQIISFDYGNY